MPAKVQLVLPGLFDLPLGELPPGLLDNKLPHLNRLLRLATPQPNRINTIDEILKAVLGLEGSAGLPLAQAFKQSEMHGPERLLLSQAVHLQAGLHSAVIVPIPNYEENLKDINIIINDLNELFKVECNISAIADGLFLLQLHAFSAPTHFPHILSVLGKTANPYIEQSRNILHWYQLLNEIQMFMHQHEINVERVRRGLLPINSLWCWGAGGLPPVVDAKPGWYCDDPILNQFARSLELKPESCSRVAEIDDATDSVVIDLRLLELLKTGVDKEPDPLLLNIDNDLLRPLMQAVEKHRCRLTLMAGYNENFELGPGARLKFWRPHRTLSYWAGDPYES
ncbi:MAG: hypothetical protein OES20_16830 [Gammaproteobacteria bacterium]|nr:hypothetical protein [Gammaproteobacteria bacterium]